MAHFYTTAVVAAVVVARLCSAAVTPNTVAGCMVIGSLPSGCPQTIGGDCPRCYNNTVPDYSPGASLSVSDEALASVKSHHAEYLEMMLQQYQPGNARDATVYTGSAGAALNMLKLYNRTGNSSHLDAAYSYHQAAMSELPSLISSAGKNGYVSFFWGPTGVYAVGAAIASYRKDAETAATHIKSLYTIIAANDAQHDDLLPGRAGLLFAARFVAANNPLNLALPWTDADLLNIALTIVDNGRLPGVAWLSWPPPASYGTKRNLGTTHGTCGVLHELLYVPSLLANDTARALIVTTLDHVLSMQFTTGNFPEMYENPLDDVLVQWDHGAPGVSTTLFHAGKVLGNTSYTDAAERAQDCVWERGLVTKGLQNCHGMSGNIYTMGTAYKLTGNPKYLYRAARFVEFMVSHPSLVDPSQMRQMSPSWVTWTFWPASYQAAEMLWTDVLSGENGSVDRLSMSGFEPEL